MTGEVITESEIEGFEFCETAAECLGTTAFAFITAPTSTFSTTGYGGYGDGEQAVLILLDGPGGYGGGSGDGQEAVLITLGGSSTGSGWFSSSFSFTNPSFTGSDYEIATDVVKMNI